MSTSSVGSHSLESQSQMEKGKKQVNDASEKARTSARWDEFTHLQFIELVEKEIQKGNRPGSFINTDGWKSLVKNFNEITGKCYDNKQLKNHWDAMKKEWIIFKQMMLGESGLDWDKRKKTIAADNDWWDKKIKENENFRKFKNKDLSLLWFRYDALFFDIAAIGENARIPSQYQAPTQLSSTDKDEETNENTQDMGEFGEAFGVQDTPSIATIGDNLIPEPSWQLGTLSGPKKQRRQKVSSAATSRTNTEDLMLMYSTSTNTSFSVGGPSEPSLRDCFSVMQKLPIQIGSLLWSFSSTLLCKPRMRVCFIHQPNDEARMSWLEYLHKKDEDKRVPH